MKYTSGLPSKCLTTPSSQICSSPEHFLHLHIQLPIKFTRLRMPEEYGSGRPYFPCLFYGISTIRSSLLCCSRRCLLSQIMFLLSLGMRDFPPLLAHIEVQPAKVLCI